MSWRSTARASTSGSRARDSSGPIRSADPGKRAADPDDIAVLYVGDEAEKQALLLGEPDLFFTSPGYDGWPLVMLGLTEVSIKRLRELVTDAWRMRAPAALLADLD